MTCEHIAFGAVNLVEASALSAAPEPVTPLDWLGNTHRARRTRWTDLGGPIVVEGLHDAPQAAEYFALMGSNLPAAATLKLELFATDTSAADLLELDPVAVGQMIPLGEWSAGQDGFGARAVERGDAPLVLWFGRRIKHRRWRLTIEHGHVVEPPVFNDTPTQDEFGVVSLEAESADITNLGARRWEPVADAAASGGTCLHKTGGGFWDNPGEGSSARFVFSATRSGAHKIWTRCKSPASGGNDSFHISLDGAATTVSGITVDDAWHWEDAATVNLVDGSDHELVLSAREDNLSIDKVVILPSADPAPTGVGPAASDPGVIGSDTAVDIRHIRLGAVWRPERNLSYGLQYQQMTAPETGQTTSGHQVPLRPQREVRQLAFDLGHMTDSDRYQLQQMERERAGRPFFVSVYPGRPGWMMSDHTMLGRLGGQQQYTHQFIDWHSTQVSITEA